MDISGELQKAAKRIGLAVSPRKQMAWLLDFIQRNLDECSAGQWQDLTYEFITFERFDLMAGLSGGRKRAGNFQQLSFDIGTGMGKQIDAMPTHAHITGAQQHLKSSIVSFLDAHLLKFDFPKVTLKIESKRPFIKVEGADYVYPCDMSIELPEQHLLDWKVCFLMGVFGHQIRRCRECQKIFLAERKNLFFCERKCVNRYGQRNFQEKKRQAKRTKTPTPKRKGKK